MLAKGGQRVSEIDRDLGCRWTSRLKVAIARDRTDGIAREKLVRRVDLVGDRICRSAGDDEEEQPAHRSEDAPARCRAPAWNARTRHRPTLIDEPIHDQQDEGDPEEDLKPVLRTDATVGRHRGGANGAQRISVCAPARS